MSKDIIQSVLDSFDFNGAFRLDQLRNKSEDTLGNTLYPTIDVMVKHATYLVESFIDKQDPTEKFPSPQSLRSGRLVVSAFTADGQRFLSLKYMPIESDFIKF